MEPNKYCYICGYDFEKENKFIEKFSICSCCLFQYGIDDSLYGKNGIMDYRQEWINNGFPFQGKLVDDEDWNINKLEKQIRNTSKCNINEYPIKGLIILNLDWSQFKISSTMLDEIWKNKRKS